MLAQHDHEGAIIAYNWSKLAFLIESVVANATAYLLMLLRTC